MRSTAPTHSPPAPPVPAAIASAEARRLLIWRESLIGSLWRPGRVRAPALYAELRRTERRLVEIFWPERA